MLNNMDMHLFIEVGFGGMIGGKTRLKCAESKEKERNGILNDTYMTIGKCAMSWL